MISGEIFQNFKNTHFEEHLSVNGCFWEYFKRSYWTLPQGLYILMLLDFPYFLLWAVYPSMVHFNKSWVMYLYYVWLSWQGKNQKIFNKYQN